jgi:UDP-3-O-[3-hydroxymyristoyl] glucosamine N-acyltransferase
MRFTKGISVKELAVLISAECIGDEEIIATGINEIHMVEDGDITFVDHPKYYEKVLQSKASVVIINRKEPAPRGKALLYVQEPFTAYVSLVKRFRPFIPAAAMVSDTAEIGEGTIIQPGAFIGNHVKIGRNCLIHANVTINDHCVLGDEVIINSNVVIGGDAFYFKRRPTHFEKMESCGRVVIGNQVEIGAGTTIDRGVSGDTTIGDGSKLDNLIQIGHDTVIGKHCLIASQVGIAGVTVIQDYVTIWGQVGIQKDLVIESGAEILAKSGVPKSLKGNTTYFGIPVREAREKMKEIALLKQLPGILAEITEKL